MAAPKVIIDTATTRGPEPKPERPAGLLRVWCQFVIAAALLALFQSDRLAGTLEDTAAELSAEEIILSSLPSIPRACEQGALALRSVYRATAMERIDLALSDLVLTLSTDRIVGKAALPATKREHFRGQWPFTDQAGGPVYHLGDQIPLQPGKEDAPATSPQGLTAPSDASGPSQAEMGQDGSNVGPVLENGNVGDSQDQAAPDLSGSLPGAETNATDRADIALNATAQTIDPEVSPKPLVLLIGDSMMMEGLGPVLLRNLRAREDLEVVREARYSTGLSRMDYFDWPAHMEELVEKYSPAVVVITIGGNDAQDIVDENKKRHFVGTDSWAEQYQQRAELLAQAAESGGAAIVWVGLPIMGNPTHAQRTLLLSERQQAVCEGSDNRIFVDTLPLLSDEKGEFIAFVKNEQGGQTRIRYKDKIHVTSAGGEILTAVVVPEIERLLADLGQISEDTSESAQPDDQDSKEASSGQAETNQPDASADQPDKDTLPSAPASASAPAVCAPAPE